MLKRMTMMLMAALVVGGLALSDAQARGGGAHSGGGGFGGGHMGGGGFGGGHVGGFDGGFAGGHMGVGGGGRVAGPRMEGLDHRGFDHHRPGAGFYGSYDYDDGYACDPYLYPWRPYCDY